MIFKCGICGEEYSYGEIIWKCRCGGHLNLINESAFCKDDIKQGRFNMWRYDKAYPISKEEASVSFNEGLTPLCEIEYEGNKVKVKLDSLMPTCSFKDRGTVMVINYLKNSGVDYITEDSSGNAASSVAAYCALGGIKCAIFVPAGNSSGKIMQAKAYGGDISPITGSREDVAAAAQVYEKSYAGHNWHPLFSEGIKSIAFEIWEQSGFKAPDNIIAPCGGGSLVLGLYKGFMDLLRGGAIDKLPKIIAVQPANCNPVYRLFHEDKSPFQPKPTVAEGTSIAKPVKPYEIIQAVKNSGGTFESVEEEEIFQALEMACKQGVYIEPTSAIAFAAYSKLREKAFINKNEETVIIATGGGLKSGETINRLLFEK